MVLRFSLYEVPFPAERFGGYRGSLVGRKQKLRDLEERRKLLLADVLKLGGSCLMIGREKAGDEFKENQQSKFSIINNHWSS